MTKARHKSMGVLRNIPPLPALIIGISVGILAFSGIELWRSRPGKKKP